MAVAATNTMQTVITSSSYFTTLSVSTSKGGQNGPSRRQETVRGEKGGRHE
jgi:hypothetical protein